MRPILPILLLPMMFGSCVSTVDIFQVEVTLTLPCEPWAEIGEGTGTEDIYQIDFFRSTTSGSNGNSCSTIQTLCYNQLPPQSQRVICGESRTVLMDVGTFPEVMAARITTPSDSTSYAFLTVRDSRAYTLSLEPGVYDDELTTPWCEEVASCLLGERGDPDEDAAEAACFNGGPVTYGTPTQTPSATASPSATVSPSPSEVSSPSPTGTQSSGTQSPTEASPTEVSPTEASPTSSPSSSPTQ